MTAPTPPTPPSTPPFSLGEDWTAVAVAAVLAALAVAGVVPSIPRFAWDSAADAAGLVSAANLGSAAGVGVIVLTPLVVGAALLGTRVSSFTSGAVGVYLLACAAQVLAGHAAARRWSLEYVLFALLVGLALGAARVPSWLQPAVRTEYYIKAGLVVLGASVLFDEIVEAGLRGIAQALIVVIGVWTFCFWLARRLRVDDELATLMASAVSICGVSAAIATCGAIQGDTKKLSYVTSLVLVVAMPMMVVMPWIARATGMPDVVAGAWLGGTLDTSAAVVAGGEILGDAARDAAVVVKLSQNALIGVAAFLLTVWWAVRNQDAARPAASLGVIWERFPKFVFGFLLASVAFSFLLSDATVAASRSAITGIRTTLFAMAFVSIGLETSVGALISTGGGRPAVAFLGAQAFNVALTLAAAFLLFGRLFD
jgi:uncharacterized integral membrane protein (TIGR00698 family)